MYLIPPPIWEETEEGIDRFIKGFRETIGEDGIAVDTETTGLDISRDVAILMSISSGDNRAAFPIPASRRSKELMALLMDESVPKIGTNIKYDFHILHNTGIPIRGRMVDTLCMDWLFDENRFSHGLKETASDYLNLNMVEFKEVFKLKKKETSADAIARAFETEEGKRTAIEYASLDAYASFGVYEYLKKRLKNIEVREGYTLWDYFYEIETRFTQTLWNCERRGITICTGHLKAQEGPMHDELEDIEERFSEAAGGYVNLNSTKQLRGFFYGTLGKKPFKFTSGGKSGIKQPSTDEEVLSTWAREGDEYAKMLLRHREISKTYSTYVKGLLQSVDHELKIHTTLNQHVVVTGRLSSRSPNLQNIPRTSGDKFGIRYAFVADPGYVLIVSDYEQLEMRLMAHCSQDEKMIEAINNGVDLHCYTVEKMFNIPYEEVLAAKKADDPTPEQKELKNYRQVAKSIGFGLIYGIGPMKLSHDLSETLGREVTINEAKRLIEQYFSVFEGARKYIFGTRENCKKSRLKVLDPSIENSGEGVPYVQTLTGRFRRLPQINSRQKKYASQAERQAVNSIIQGSAADIAKFVMIATDNDELLQNLNVKLLLQVHDELIFQCPDDDEIIQTAKDRILELMNHPFEEDLSVPLPSDCNHAYSWGEAK